jgi:hypothetical protein
MKAAWPLGNVSTVNFMGFPLNAESWNENSALLQMFQEPTFLSGHRVSDKRFSGRGDVRASALTAKLTSCTDVALEVRRSLARAPLRP